MEKKTFEIKKTVVERMRKKMNRPFGKSGRFAVALFNYYQADYSNRSTRYQVLWNTLSTVSGKSPNDFIHFEDFYCSAVKGGIEKLIGKKNAYDLEEMLRLSMQGLFSSSMWRRSYRSCTVGDYVPLFLGIIIEELAFQSYGVTVSEAVCFASNRIPGLEERTALLLMRKDSQTIEIVREAILGENQNATLTPNMVSAIIKSGNTDLIQLLGSLLLAAKLQEGLRQMILERMDYGSVETAAYFLKLILDNKLMRFSSVVRAMNTWTGLGLAEERPAILEKCIHLAYGNLTNWKIRQNGLVSEDVLQLYFSLWGTANSDVRAAQKAAHNILQNGERYQKLTVLYFISRCDNQAVCFYIAKRYIGQRDEEILAWVAANLYVSSNLMSVWGKRPEKRREKIPSSILPSGKDERSQLFDELEKALFFVGHKNRVLKSSVFPWMSINLSGERIMWCMMSLAAWDMDDSLIKRLWKMQEYMGVSQRRAFGRNMLDPRNSFEQRGFLREMLMDKSIHVRKLSAEILGDCTLIPEDIGALCAALATKSAPVRKGILEVLISQSDALVRTGTKELLNSDEEGIFQAGLSLLESLRLSRPKLYKELLPLSENIKDKAVSSQTEIMLQKLGGTDKSAAEIYSSKNGFGLYDPDSDIFKLSVDFPPSVAAFSFGLTAEDVRRFSQKMGAIFEENADYEYETIFYDGSRQKVLLGNMRHSISPLAQAGKRSSDGCKLEDYPLAEKWRSALDEFGNAENIVLLLSGMASRYNKYKFEPWFQKEFSEAELNGFGEIGYKTSKYFWTALGIAKDYLREKHSQKLFAYAFDAYRSLRGRLDVKNWGKYHIAAQEKNVRIVYYSSRNDFALNHPYLTFWSRFAHECATEYDDCFSLWFRDKWNEYLASGKKYSVEISLDDIFRAQKLGIFPDEGIYYLLTVYPGAGDFIRLLTGRNEWHEKLFRNYPEAVAYTKTAVSRIAEVEEKRGELKTELTDVARQIKKLEGTEHFVALLLALGKEDFHRGYEFSVGDIKKEVLSSLLKHCRPKEENSLETLKALIAGTDIKDKRLAQAALYAPQWAQLVESVTGWTGLKCGVWFFHAHVSEHFSAEKETEVALFSPVTPQEFCDGAFDKNWFLKANSLLGTEKFGLLYKYAKYITTGNINHRRSQLYTDACLGKLDANELLTEIREKRNQEKLRAYPLIPFGTDPKGEALSRYEFIRLFEKESKQFGSQRKASEEKAVRIALRNLAMTAEYSDVERMIWSLEGAKFESIRHLLDPVNLDEVVSIHLSVEDGKPEIVCEKDGKSLKSLPKSFAKDERVVELKAVVKELRDQRKRSIQSLETAMTERSAFSISEVLGLLENPMLASIVETLVWRCDGALGFPSVEGKRISLSRTGKDGESVSGTELFIAHPFDFREFGCWSALQRHVLENSVIQPFKQVFREYYPITEDELAEKNISRRYAGNQVQPQRTLALLKTCGWTVDYEEGLQRVYYRENLIARMYAMADWFSPSEIESPTLEIVRFFNRESGEPVELSLVPPIVFSETMRDIDLVVSVAHVGGVDPEASYSSIELRIAIAVELLPLMSISNVKFSGAHAKIHGNLGEYSVHMGSGTVHQIGIGVISVLPIHSQHRGRLFLPFADSDPKTAEIMSKLILFAEDKKIKDPSILTQMNR